MQLLRPDYYVSHYEIVSSEWLLNHNKRYIFSDLDSTLVAHGDTGDQQFESWLTQLSASGIKLIGTSNNNNKRAQVFRDEHEVEVIEDCKKPATIVMKRYLHKHNINRSEIIFMGDQLFIDILCGNLLKADTILVEPIAVNAPFFIKLTWMLDRLLLKMLRLK